MADRVGVAASILVLFTASFLILWQPVFTKTLIAEKGQQLESVLPDASMITLNAESQVSFKKGIGWKWNRKLHLQGEAYFSVKPGSIFEVQTDAGVVSVLGTQFNVRSRVEGLEVTCFTGKVGVVTNAISKELLPGEGLRIVGGRIELEWAQTEGYQPSWRQGITSMKDSSLEEVMVELIRHYQVVVEFDEVVDVSIRTNAVFAHDNLPGALRSILEPLDLQASINKNTVTVSKQEND